MLAILAAVAVTLLRLRTTLIASAVFTILVLAILFGTAARAAPVVIDNEYDFSKGPLGWTSQNVSYNGAPVPNSWQWSGGQWHVDPVAVPSYRYWAGNYLTSPVIEVAATIDILEFNMIQRFRFPQNITTGAPVVAGELVYRIFDANNPNAAFQPFALGAFETGLVPPPFDAKTSFPNWVAPSFVAPTDRPPLIPLGGTWIGTSPGYDTDQYVASRATLTQLLAGQKVEFRLINANLGLQCEGGGWDVSYVRVNGFAPEPGTIGLAATGGGLALACGLLRSRRRRLHTGEPQ
jgi:hypothetical protein